MAVGPSSDWYRRRHLHRSYRTFHWVCSSRKRSPGRSSRARTYGPTSGTMAVADRCSRCRHSIPRTRTRCYNRFVPNRNRRRQRTLRIRSRCKPGYPYSRRLRNSRYPDTRRLPYRQTSHASVYTRQDPAGSSRSCFRPSQGRLHPQASRNLTPRCDTVMWKAAYNLSRRYL